jgi:transcriptional regulator
MYVPAHFAAPNLAGPSLAACHQVIDANSFGAFVSVIDGAPFSTHIPFLLDPDRGKFGTLLGHVAAANPHSRALESTTPSLAIFQGPHCYVSPSWYDSPLMVPTWNYVAVHATGATRIISDANSVRAYLERLSETHESKIGGTFTLA